MPTFLLKRQVLVNLPTDNLDPAVARSIDFMVDRVSHYFFIHVYLKYDLTDGYNFSGTVGLQADFKLP